MPSQNFYYNTPYPYFPAEEDAVTSMAKTIAPPDPHSSPVTSDVPASSLSLDCNYSSPYYPQAASIAPIAPTTAPPDSYYSSSARPLELEHDYPSIHYCADQATPDIFLNTDPDPELWSVITSTDQTTAVPSNSYHSPLATFDASARDLQLNCDYPSLHYPSNQAISGSGTSSLDSEPEDTRQRRLVFKSVSCSGTDPYYKPLPKTFFINNTSTGENLTHLGTSTHSQFQGKTKPRQRQAWPHAFEHIIFSPLERSTIPLDIRRATYITSLESHVERLHGQISQLGFWPVPLEDLKEFEGLHVSKAKSMIAGLFHDVSVLKEELCTLELEDDQLRQEAVRIHGYSPFDVPA